MIACLTDNDCSSVDAAYGYMAQDIDEYLEANFELVRQYYESSSWSGLDIAFTVMDKSEMLTSAYSCAELDADPFGQLSEMQAAAAALGYDAGYDTHWVIAPYCAALPWSGLGAVGADGNWLNTGGDVYWNDAATMAHEIGHNYGANHAGDRMIEYGNVYSVMGSADLPEGHFLAVGKEVFDWFDDGLLAHAVAPADASLCDAAASACSVGGGTFTLQASDTGALGADGYVALRIYTPTADWYYYVEHRSQYADLASHALVYWTPVYESSGATGIYGYTQIVDAHGATSSLADAGLNVSETLLLDLEGTGAVLTVDAVDAAAQTLTVTVEFAVPGSGYHEAHEGVAAELSLDGAALALSLGGAEPETKVLSLGTTDPAALVVSASCESADGAVALYVHEQYPLNVVAYGADASVSAVAALEFDSCVTSGTGCDRLELELGYSNTDGVYSYTAFPESASTDVDFYYYSADLGMYLYRLYSQYWCLGDTLESSSMIDYVQCDVLTFPEVVYDCAWPNSMAGATATCSAGRSVAFDLTNMYAGGQADDGDVWDAFSSANYVVARVADASTASLTLTASAASEAGACGTNRYLNASSDAFRSF